MKLNENLRILREARNLSQAELAEQLNISRTTYANYEQGRRTPDYETLIILANFYEVSLDTLFSRSSKGEFTLIEMEQKFPSTKHKDVYEKLLGLEARELNLLNQYISILYDKDKKAF